MHNNNDKTHCLTSANVRTQLISVFYETTDFWRT